MSAERELALRMIGPLKPADNLCYTSCRGDLMIVGEGIVRGVEVANNQRIRFVRAE